MPPAFPGYMDMDAAGEICNRKEGLPMASLFLRLRHEETGQSVAEYAIIAATVALLVVGAVSLLGLTVKTLLEVPFPANK